MGLKYQIKNFVSENEGIRKYICIIFLNGIYI